MGRAVKLLAVAGCLLPVLAYGAAVPQTGQWFLNDCNTMTNPVALRTYCSQGSTTGGLVAGHNYRRNAAGNGWDDITSASGLSFTPAGNISSTDLQSALQELDTEKLATSGNAATATTATQLAGTPTQCAAGQSPRGISANGNAANCQVLTAGGDASTNTASSVDGEVVLFSGTGGKTLKRATTSGILKATSGVLSAAAAGTDYVAPTSGSALQKGDGKGGLTAASAGTDYAAATATKTIYFDAGAINVDGTNCTDPTEDALNGLDRTWNIACADNDNSHFSGKVRMPAGWDGGTITFTLSVTDLTTETVTFAGAFTAQCRGNGEVFNSTYGTPVTTDVSITTAYAVAETTSAAVTPNGTCAGGKFLFWHYAVSAASYTATNARVLGVTMRYTANVTD